LVPRGRDLSVFSSFLTDHLPFYFPTSVYWRVPGLNVWLSSPTFTQFLGDIYGWCLISILLWQLPTSLLWALTLHVSLPHIFTCICNWHFIVNGSKMTLDLPQVSTQRFPYLSMATPFFQFLRPKQSWLLFFSQTHNQSEIQLALFQKA
jgi:hypothetical protein